MKEAVGMLVNEKAPLVTNQTKPQSTAFIVQQTHHGLLGPCLVV